MAMTQRLPRLLLALLLALARSAQGLRRHAEQLKPLAFAKLLGSGRKQKPHERKGEDYQLYLKGFESFILTNFTGCDLSANNSCGLAEMRRNDIHMVYPGGNTLCMDSKKPYGFMVVPRDQDKLLINFEGGGACWDRLSVGVKACYISQSRPRKLLGYMDHMVPDNPFKDHTVVYITACSGDLHAGNVKHKYRLEQRGYNNVRATVDWIQENFEKPFSSLVIGGESAGSIGVQVWAHNLLSELRYEKASVIADSYVSVFPTGFTGPVFKSLEVCHSGLLDFSADILEKCDSGVLTVPDVFEAAIADFPQVNFGSISSKYDPVQMDYYDMTSLSMGRPSKIVAEQFREKLQATLARYHKYPNHGHFLFSSKWHVFTCQIYHDLGRFSNATFTDGIDGTMRRRFEEWMAHLAAHDGGAGDFCESLDPKLMLAKDLGPNTDDCAEGLGSIALKVESPGGM